MLRSAAPDKPRVKQVADAVSEMFLVVDKAEPERETMLADLQTQLAKMQALTGTAEAGPPSGPPGAIPSGPPGAGPPSGPPSAGPPAAGPTGGG